MYFNRISRRFSLLFFLGIFCIAVQAMSKGSFTAGNRVFLLNGKPFVVKAAEVHYPRIPRAYWEQRIKMCKALGMNTLCLYVFWNIHEQQEGVFDFSGNKDVAAFCRLAQKNGMYVIVRPGPYVCAEWEMGGLPWWLLKKKNIRLREQDPYFMERVKIFEKKVGEQLAPLTIDHGGPIIMVQVENEYGSYGKNKPYVSAIRDILRQSGFTKVTLFQCDWASNFTRNGLDGLVWTMNFGTGANIDEQFRRLTQLRPSSPRMCSEFWSGWFDKWGARHETRPAKAMVEGIDEMLSKGISFSLYMTHGGTSFGHWAGANSPGFQPDVTSYDYDAPINEYGMPTPKYYELRKIMKKYSGGKTLPKIPKAPMPVITIPVFKLQEYSPVLAGVDSISRGPLMTFEDMNFGWGQMVYTTILPEIDKESTLSADIHDYARIYLNGKYVGTIDRVRNEHSIALPAAKRGDRLTILLEAMGRINFGHAIKDYKGIIGDVTLSADIDGSEVVWKPRRWECCRIKDDYATAEKAFAFSSTDLTARHELPQAPGQPGYYRGYFNLKKRGDTFLNMEAFGKGQVYVNGHPLGRFWHIGPQQTLYLPGCWLRKGRNEVIVLDMIGPKGVPALYGQNHPELDKLILEKSNKHNDPGHRPDLNSAVPALTAAMAPGNGWQTVKLAQPARGRYLVIEVESNQAEKDRTAIAELYLQNEKGERIDRSDWTAWYADSEAGNHTLDKAMDLQESTFWQTEKAAPLPHLLVLDMGKENTVTALEYLPREESGAPGSIRRFKLYVR